MISNDFKKEIERKGLKFISFDRKTDKMVFRKNERDIVLKVSTIRKIFLNSIIIHIDNNYETDI